MRQLDPANCSHFLSCEPQVAPAASVLFEPHKESLVPFSILDLAFVAQGSTRRTRCTIRLIWRSTLSAGAIAVSGWPSTTTWSGSPAPQLPSLSDMLPEAPRPSAWALAESCCPIIRQSSSRNSLARLNRSIPGASISALAALPALTSEHCARFAAIPPARIAFPDDVRELQAFLGPLQPGQSVRLFLAPALNVPIWILGSSLFGAQLAADFGLPYAFASHFAPDALMLALQVYRREFRPSAQLDKPYAMVGVNVIVAETDAEARRLFTSAQQGFTNAVRGTRRQLAPPIDDIESYWSPMEKAHVSNMLACSFVGSPQTVRTGLEKFIEQTRADELMVSSAIYDHSARLRSYELLAGIA